MVSKWEVQCDGGCPTPGGPGAWAFVVNDGPVTILRRSGFLPRATNNEAEYRAITAAAITLRSMEKTLPALVEFWCDSQLVAYQLTGRYQVRDSGLRPFYEEAKNEIEALRKHTRVSINWFPREENTEADELCNKVFDRRGIELKKARKKLMQMRDALDAKGFQHGDGSIMR